MLSRSSRSALTRVPALLACLAALTIAPAVSSAGDEPSAASSPAASPGWLGILAQEITPELRESMDLPAKGGVLVGQVVDESPAEKAGIEAGDAVLELDGKAMDDPQALRAYVGEQASGARMEVRLVHDGKERSVTVELAPRPEKNRLMRRNSGDRDERTRVMRRGPGEAGMPGLPGFPPTASFADGTPKLGIRIEPMSEDLADYFKVSGDGGVLVVEVMPDTPAQKAGMKAGDVIQKVDDTRVSSPEELVRAISGSGDDEVKISVRRKGKDITLSATPELASGRRMSRAGHAKMQKMHPQVDEIGQIRNELRELREELRELKAKN